MVQFIAVTDERFTSSKLIALQRDSYKVRAPRERRALLVITYDYTALLCSTDTAARPLANTRILYMSPTTTLNYYWPIRGSSNVIRIFSIISSPDFLYAINLREVIKTLLQFRNSSII